MTTLEEYKLNLKNQYNIELTSEDYTVYKKRIKKAVMSEIIGIILGTIIILFIVFGLLFGALPNDQYTYIPLFVVACLTVMGASSLTKKVKTAEMNFIEFLKQKYNLSTSIAHQPSVPQARVQIVVRQPLVVAGVLQRLLKVVLLSVHRQASYSS